MIWKKQQAQIFSLFLRDREQKFSDIVKATGIRSNLLNYYLRDFLKRGILESDGEYYRVSDASEYLIPFFQQFTGAERLKLPVVLVAIVNSGKILLVRRDKRPYKGYWSLPGGKIRFNERLRDTAVRTALTEVGLSVKCVSLCHVADEFLHENFVKHGWLLFLVKARSLPKQQSNGLWFSLKNLPARMIASDRWLIQNCLYMKTHFSEIVINEHKGIIQTLTVQKI